MKRNKHIPAFCLNNEKGAASVTGILVIASVFIMLFLILGAYGIRLYNARSVIAEIHSAANQVVTMAVTTNAEESYYNKREGYSGAYKSKTHEEILELMTKENVEKQLTSMLHLNTPPGKKLGKYVQNPDGSWTPLYCIANIDVAVDNPKLKEKSEYIQAKTKLLVYIPFDLGSMISKHTDLKLYITASASNMPKF